MVIFQKHDHQVTYIEANLSVKTSLLWKTVPLSSILYFEISDLIGRNQSYVTVFPYARDKYTSLLDTSIHLNGLNALNENQKSISCLCPKLVNFEFSAGLQVKKLIECENWVSRERNVIHHLKCAF